VSVAVLTVRDLTKSYVTGNGTTVTALDRVSFSVRQGEFVCIIGPSGCGKSTLLQIAAGLQPASGGEVQLKGRTIRGHEQGIGMVFQEYALLPWKTVEENIGLGLKYRGMPKTERRTRVRRLVEKFGLHGFESSYPHQLSGGMRQRVAIARTLCIDPEVLLMDEPFGALDSQTREYLQEDLLRIWGEELPASERKTVLFVTHSIDEALILADRILLMTYRPGRVISLVDNPIVRPRGAAVRGAAEFVKIRQEVWDVMRRETERALIELGGTRREPMQ
jgi:NitT/TauT family transport system ATP-binding protein